MSDNKQKSSTSGSANTEVSFESAMIDLEALVTKIETGNLSLEDSLKEFENGIKLSRICQSALKDAERRVKILSDGNDDEQDFTGGVE
ncbi:MAG: exodeoxyribonuclease VII small subunit [Cocleimonas sp.]